ncbi:hypothetical protein [Ideonella sp. BN130291]|uniref:hypothetical protein n=1 Tax=Ideonella sp. BN130291 TaxID=3112940 RepID=UPI002E26EC3E|nr:hypothetical protein [Ideonella sp. BN130291]
MNESVVQRVSAIGVELRLLVQRLRVLGYEFHRPDEVLPGVAPDTSEAISRIERLAGPVPAALKAFWLIVGSVDLSGGHPQWSGCEYPDPLVVLPPSYALYELDEYMEDREVRDAEGLPFAIPVAPDFFHKANVSGGPPYEVAVPATADDPPLNNAPQHISLLEYVELSLRWGGFAGLQRCVGHSWPVDSLVAAQGS